MLGKHIRNDPASITVDKLDYMLAYTDRLLITFFDYKPDVEIHGFQHEAFDKYAGIHRTDTAWVKVGRGGLFGGSRAYLEVACKLLFT
jgi:hypothetical protein